jgi:glutamate-1-semialdehyde 2,1-aminomutase
MDKERLLSDLIEEYKKKHLRSEQWFEKSRQYLIMGGSHTLRLFQPFPFYDVRCQGSKVTDLDGNTYVDFWQGHFANILGHNPPVVINALTEEFGRGEGLATGFPGTYQYSLAELILKQVKLDRIRFTTSGSLATMYAIMLARSFTGHKYVLKIGGGWHGSQPYALKGISIFQRGLNQIESAGLHNGMDSALITTCFNSIEDLEEKFDIFKDDLACMIMEPFIGAGGFIFGQREYIEKARELTEKHGVLLIFDEVVSGFRFHAGALHSLYGITPDLSVYGKAIGGGMPISAVAGRKDIMSLCSIDAPTKKRVKFEGGTFSAHPSAMLAGITFINYLIEHEKEIYPRIGKLGQKARDGIESIFSQYGFNVCCTGGNESIVNNSSVIGVHFLNSKIEKLTSPDEAWDPGISDFELREKIFKLAMLAEGFNTFHGYGTISTAHSEIEIDNSLNAVENIAKKWRKYN